jgi:D-sedoheptulose 7-phosphate isomerase
VINEAIKNWNKVLICWNGWSAADSQHFAAEFLWQYKMKRKALAAIALSTDTSILTAIWNDYWFDIVFSRQVEWLWKEWDILVWISTSWNSINVIKAVESAKAMWIKTVWLLWKWGGKLKDLMDYTLIVPSDNTPRIQECHETIYHTICEEVEIANFRN